MSPLTSWRNGLAGALTLAAVVVLWAGPCHAVSSAKNQATLTDSLTRVAAGYYGVEPTVQEILDGLGYNLNAATDALGNEWFCAAKGPVTVGIVGEYSGLADDTRFLWYRAGRKSDTLLVLPGISSAGDSSVFFLPSVDTVAFCFNIPGYATWFSETRFNYDNRRHVKVYPTPDRQMFLIFWEDLAWLADGDFNDLVLWVRFASPAPALAVNEPPAGAYYYMPDSTICLDLSAESFNCNGDPITIRMLEGPGTFAPLTGYGSLSGQHCFSTPIEGLHTFVFEASLPGGSRDVDTLTIPVSASGTFASPQGIEISVNRHNAFTICRPETVCVPFAVTSTCQLVDIRTAAPAFIDIIASTICYYATGGVEFCIPLVAEDGCGRKDSTMVCFIIEANEPTTLTCPSVVDTTLCNAGFVTFPVSVSGGTPPITITAVPPAVYNSSTGKVSVLAEQTGSFDVYTIVDNAECPPETCVTRVNARVNTPPTILGIPDTVVKVCGSGQYCFGPIVCADAENNLSTCRLWSGPGTYDGTTWCYTPTSNQTVRAIFRATDACGRVRLDTLTVQFTLSTPPSITFNDITTTLCGPQTVCVPYSISNPSGQALSLYLIGPGTLDQPNSRVCLPISSSGNYPLTLVAQTACGSADTATAVIHATLNAAPAVTCASPADIIRCSGSNVCVSYTVADPNGGSVNLAIHAGGSIINRTHPSGTTDSICIPVTQTGQQTVTIIATDACGAADTCTTTFPIQVNAAPSVTVRDTTIFLCAPAPVCIPVACADVNNNLTSCQATGSKSGTFNGGAYCFTPDTSGVYTVTGTATDACGQTAQATARVTIVLNRPPVINVSATNVTGVRDGDTVCIDVSVTDADGNLTEVVALDNYLSFDGSRICLVGIVNEAVCARIIATDACGRRDTAIVCVFAEPSPTPRPNLPDTLSTRFCAPGDVCLTFSMGASECPPVTLAPTGNGILDIEDSTLCLAVGAPGYYQTGLIVSDTCGTETTFVVIHAAANDPPVLSCPGPSEFLICRETTICLALTYSDPNGNVAGATASFGQLTGPAGGNLNLCLPADTSGWYSSQVIVFDSCGAADTCDVAVFVQRNRPPFISMPADLELLLCGPEMFCFDIACEDPDSNLAECVQVVSGNGTWDGESLCFTPSVPGTYQWVFRATDACGGTVTDTFRVMVEFKTGPSIVAPQIVDFELCGPDTVCVPFVLLNPDGGPLTVTSTLGEVRPNQTVCVYRTAPGEECLTLIVTDSCGLADTAGICLRGTVTPAPVVTAPEDFARRICGPGQVCFDVAVTHDKPWLGSVGPVGLFNNADTSVCFNADTAGIYTLIVRATDGCGAVGADTLRAEISFNRPPSITVPSNLTRVFCGPGPLCVGGFAASDPDGNLMHFIKLTGSGTFDPGAGSVCFDADTAGVYCFQFAAQDSCNAAVASIACVTLIPNQPPALSINPPSEVLLFEEPTQICFGVSATDPNAGQRRTLSKVSGAGVFADQTAHAAINAQHCFLADTTGCYRFIFAATDSCGARDEDTALVCVRIEPPDSLFRICIDNVQSLNGRNATVKIRGNEMMEMGGYDFLVCYDPTVLSFSQAHTDSALAGWEYFTYRVGASTGCASCGSSVIRLIGIFDMPNGQGPPPAEKRIPKGPMFRLVFFVTADRLFINFCAPIRFCFEDCGDNTISSPTGDTLYMALTGVNPDCLVGGKSTPLQRIQYCNGSLCIIPPPDDRGDINLNGIANEVADAVLFANFFIYGPAVWDPIFYESQILATDVNCDGLVLTVADLVYLIRIITHDALPINCPDGPGKVAPIAGVGRLTFERKPGILEAWLETGDDLGGVFVHLSGVRGSLGQLAWGGDLGGLTPYLNQTDAGVRALLVARQTGARLPAGRRMLFSIPWDGSANWQLVESQAATTDGGIVQLEVVSASKAVPTGFGLEQNHPNPFNAGTQIRFRLGETAEWELTIFNVLGQPVRRFNGAGEPGYVTIEWDSRNDEGRNVASGVYFSRLKVGDFTASKKMVLLK